MSSTSAESSAPPVNPDEYQTAMSLLQELCEVYVREREARERIVSLQTQLAEYARECSFLRSVVHYSADRLANDSKKYS